MADDTITIKGIREGLVVTLPVTFGAWSDALAHLEARLNTSPAFFKGARAALVIGPRELAEQDIRTARDLLLRHDVTLWGLVSDDPATVDAAAHLGLDTRLPPRETRAGQAPAVPTVPASPPPPAPQTLPAVAQAAAEAEAALVLRRTLRSGMSLRHPGSIVVIGDVHSGAEVIAGGDVIVWGKLHGMVHAGAFGDDEAVVCALDLSPIQLRIGRYITRSPEGHRKKVQPEMARVMHGRIEAMAWGPKGGGR